MTSGRTQRAGRRPRGTANHGKKVHDGSAWVLATSTSSKEAISGEGVHTLPLWGFSAFRLDMDP